MGGRGDGNRMPPRHAAHRDKPRLLATQIIKHHPASVDLELIKRLAAATPDASLLGFLCKQFACISHDLAGSEPMVLASRFLFAGQGRVVAGACRAQLL